MQKIAFVLPGPTRYISGGYKVFYEYAEYFSSLGFSVDVIYLTNKNITRKNFVGLKGLAKKVYYRFAEFYSWFHFEAKVYHEVAEDLDSAKYDLIFFSSIEIARYVADLIDVEEHEKLIYFIQGYEVWNHSASEVAESYRYGFSLISISTYLTECIERSGALVDLFLPNGVDHHFRCVENQQLENVGLTFMYHPGSNKGCSRIIDNVEMLCCIFGTIRCFSTYRKPNDFPKNIEYIYQPSRDMMVDLYNSTDYFMCSSYNEGFGLTVAEAMACGCCIITTDNGGVSDLVIEGDTGYYIDFSNSKELKANLEKIVSSDNSSLRKNAIDRINSNFRWELSKKSLLNFIKERG